ncbi:MAG: RNA-binding protein, partial [Thaumarchaeota archaeon]
VMRPGIRTFDEWGEAGRLVVVREEKKGRGISVGRSLLSSSEMARVQKGPSLKNLHYVGDRFWNLYKLV